ncbi:MAG: SAM-dependent methyltransferase [Desulfobacterales bacterium]|nr:MAG: SAM-dependent methyltransferase [Desulfobacterales bacterium]
MAADSIRTFKDIDWVTLRNNAMARKGWKRKTASDWDKKAESFSESRKHHQYIHLFLEKLPLDSTSTVLDIGAGPGTLALPVAKRAKEVTAIDFSQSMLDLLNKQAEEQGLNNIRTVKCAWEDDWQKKQIAPHQIAIASRSMGVQDLPAALQKINSFATDYVFLSDRVGPTPFEPAAFDAIGRDFQPGPDYIYTVNTLYTMGIYPNISMLELDRDTVCSSMEEAFDSYRWMFHDLTPKESGLLRTYLEKHVVKANKDQIIIRRPHPVRWALIWWQKDKSPSSTMF